MKIEQTGFCSDLEVGERFTARLTGQSYAAKGIGTRFLFSF